MTAKQKVLEKYPEAEAVHISVMGLRFYAIRTAYGNGRGFDSPDALTASKAWTRAAKAIAAGKLPERLTVNG